MLTAKNIEEAIALSVKRKGQTVHFPCGAVRFADKLPLGTDNKTAVL